MSLEEKNYNSNTLDTWSVQRRAQLTKKIAYLALVVGAFYIVFDFIFEAYNYIPFYFILFAGSALCLTLLRYQYYTLAKFALFIPGLLLLTLFASWETRETGIYLYFLIIVLGAITIFGVEEKWYAIGLAGITILAFYLVYYSDLFIYEQITLTQEYIEQSLLINFAVCVFAAFIMLYYILTINQQYEKRARQTQEDLLKTTKQLKESKRNFELALRGSSAGIWVLDIEANKLYISPQMSRMLGHSGAERFDIDRGEFMSYLHPDDADYVNDSLNNHIENKERFEVECRLKKKSGDYIWVLDTGQAEWDKSGNPIKMVGSIVDINERKKAEEEVYEKNAMLRKTNEELDRFVYSTSHDLRAPLSSILGLINLIESTNDEEEKVKCLQLMRERINTLNGFIADIINYSRNTRLEINQEEVILSKVIDKVFANLEYFENQKNISVKKTFPSTFRVKCDIGRLRIILNNLIANAIKYHDLDKQQPWIKIHAKENSRNVIIEVEDNGQGIDKTYQDKIFDMFYRASETSEGSGLGLYIAREMTEKLKGELSVDSVAGEGSVFRLKIPKEINS